jgi:hypothetical protein
MCTWRRIIVLTCLASLCSSAIHLAKHPPAKHALTQYRVGTPLRITFRDSETLSRLENLSKSLCFRFGQYLFSYLHRIFSDTITIRRLPAYNFVGSDSCNVQFLLQGIGPLLTSKWPTALACAHYSISTAVDGIRVAVSAVNCASFWWMTFLQVKIFWYVTTCRAGKEAG